MDTGSNRDTGPDVDTGSGGESDAGSKIGSGVSSGTGSDLCSTSRVEGPGCGVAVACEGKWFRPESCLGSGESGSVGQERW